MDWMNLLNQVLEVCVLPLLGVLTVYIVVMVRAKAQQLAKQTENELAQKYISMLADTITECVIATNQTYVNALKDKELFDINAQREAFKRTYDAVMNILSDEAIGYLENVYGDLEAYIKDKIEAEVNKNK